MNVREALPAGISLYGYTLREMVSSSALCLSYSAMHELLQEEVLLHEFFPEGCAGRDPQSLMVLPIAGSEAAFGAALNDFGSEMRRYAALQNPRTPGVTYALSEEGLTFCVQPVPQGEPLFSVCHANPGEEQIKALLEQALTLLRGISGQIQLPESLNPATFYLSSEEALSLNLFGAAALDTSAGYTALECVQRGSNVGLPAAVYSLGAIMYCLITGQAPQAVSTRIGKVDTYAPLAQQSELKAVYSAELLTSIDKSLALWQEDRWQDFAAWQKALQNN
jgi:hypothetical protein